MDIKMLMFGICEQMLAMSGFCQTAINLAWASVNPFSMKRPAISISVSVSVPTGPPPWVFMAVKPIPAFTQAATARFISLVCIRR